jgi:hypothetical protein
VLLSALGFSSGGSSWVYLTISSSSLLRLLLRIVTSILSVGVCDRSYIGIKPLYSVLLFSAI